MPSLFTTADQGTSAFIMSRTVWGGKLGSCCKYNSFVELSLETRSTVATILLAELQNVPYHADILHIENVICCKSS